MTKEVTKAYILQQMEDKFKLRDYIASKFLLDETIVPTYDIKQHLEKWEVKYKEESITAIGNKSFFAVPANERWELHRYDVVFMGAGAYTIAGANFKRSSSGVHTIYMDLTAAQTTSYHVELPKPVTLEHGDVIYVNIDGYTSPQNLRLYIDYMTEEIR